MEYWTGARYQEISPDFFRTLGIPLLRGRFFTNLDRDDSSGMGIVNETATRQFFSGNEPLGQLVEIGIGGDRVREGLLITSIGLGIGVVAAFGLTRLIANQLFGVTPMDPVTVTAVSIVLIGVALLACYVPAVRAARADPMAALRSE